MNSGDDIQTAEDLILAFKGFAESWEEWSETLHLLSKTPRLDKNDYLYTLLLIHNKKSTWYCAAACAAYSSIQALQKGEPKQIDIKKITEELIINPHKETSHAFHSVAERVCNKYSNDAIQSVKKLFEILRDTPPLSPLSLLDAEECYMRYPKDKKALMDCLRKIKRT